MIFFFFFFLNNTIKIIEYSLKYNDKITMKILYYEIYVITSTKNYILWKYEY